MDMPYRTSSRRYFTSSVSIKKFMVLRAYNAREPDMIGRANVPCSDFKGSWPLIDIERLGGLGQI